MLFSLRCPYLIFFYACLLLVDGQTKQTHTLTTKKRRKTFQNQTVNKIGLIRYKWCILVVNPFPFVHLTMRWWLMGSLSVIWDGHPPANYMCPTWFLIRKGLKRIEGIGKDGTPFYLFNSNSRKQATHPLFFLSNKELPIKEK